MWFFRYRTCILVLFRRSIFSVSVLTLLLNFTQVPANRSCIQGPWKPTHPVCTVIDKLEPDTVYIVELMTFNAGVGEVSLID